MPAAAIHFLPEPLPQLQDWYGKWQGYFGDKIEIKAAKQTGQLEISGEATYGPAFPGGGVNEGVIYAEVSPSAAWAGFTETNEATLPFDVGEEYYCRVQLRRIGRWLFVEDNDHCGGANVSFTGTYRRVK